MARHEATQHDVVMGGEKDSPMIFASGLGFPEGPVSLPNGSWLVVEISPERGCISQISSNGREKRVITKTGRPNGLAVDRDGVIWAAESRNPPSLLRLTIDGQKETFLSECSGERFLLPNDLCFGPDGCLYLTDSGIPIDDFAPNNNVRPDYQTVSTDGRVYRIDTHTKAISVLDRGIRFTNGIAFGADGNLYVNETLTGNIYRYRWDGSRVLPCRELFGNVVDQTASSVMKGPDGMAFDVDGLLYCTVFGQGDVAVLNQSGQVISRLETNGSQPTNVAFPVSDERAIYVTEAAFGNVEKFEVTASGLALWN